VAGFWKAPRELARMLTLGELTPTEFALLTLVHLSGADRPGGYATTNGTLADALDVTTKTVGRALRSLREKGLLDHPDHERVAGFAVTTTDALRTLCGHAADIDPPSNVRSVSPDSKIAADTDRGSEARKPASDKASRPVESADTSGAREGPETETEIGDREKGGTLARPLAAEVVPITTSTGARDLVAFYVDRVEELGSPAPRRLVGQVARQVKELLGERIPSPVVARALDLRVERRLHPSVLPTLVPEAAGGPRRDREDVAARLRRQAIELRRREEGEA
jgi:hypothetical protein